jgi:magnesium-transporting ATPase (P-type)
MFYNKIKAIKVVIYDTFMKIILWVGIVLLVVGLAAGFLSGATSNGQPIVSFIYGTNQIMWLAIMVVGAIMILAGIVGLIIKAVKKSKQPPMQTL